MSVTVRSDVLLQTCRSWATCWHTHTRCTCDARTWLQTWN